MGTYHMWVGLVSMWPTPRRVRGWISTSGMAFPDAGNYIIASVMEHKWDTYNHALHWTSIAISVVFDALARMGIYLCKVCAVRMGDVSRTT